MKKWKLITFLIAILVPEIYLVVKYNLFQATTQMKVGFAGIFVILSIMLCLIVLMGYYLKGTKTKFTYLKQILKGTIFLLLPLVLLLLLVVCFKNNANIITEFVYVALPSYAIAIIFNPFPKWCFENNIEGLGEIFEKIKKGSAK